jgi:hypothetical protein
VYITILLHFRPDRKFSSRRVLFWHTTLDLRAYISVIKTTEKGEMGFR